MYAFVSFVVLRRLGVEGVGGGVVGHGVHVVEARHAPHLEQIGVRVVGLAAGSERGVGEWMNVRECVRGA